MGFIEDIDAMDIPDEAKESLKAAHLSDLDVERGNTAEQRRINRRTAIEEEVGQISNLFSDDKGTLLPEAIGVVKYVRRVLLSDDEEPGVALLSDKDLDLSGDDKVGADSREEVSTADVVRQIFSLLPKGENGRINLSDVVTDDANTLRPGDGNEPSDADKAKAATTRLGFSGTRTRKRYQRGGLVTAGGDS